MRPPAFDTLRDGFLSDGFALLPHAMPNDLVAAARDGVRAVAEGRFERGRPPKGFTPPASRDPLALLKLDFAHASDSRIRAIATHPAVAAAVAAVFACDRVQLWASQLLLKPSNGGQASSVGWHQDFHYWRYWSPESELCTVWVALTDVDESCGPMRFMRGSHRWGDLDVGDYFHEQGDRPMAVPDGAAPEEVPALLPSGGLSIHHPLTVHGSGANTSGRPRLSLALHLRTERSQLAPNAEYPYAGMVDDPEFQPVLTLPPVAASGVR